MINMTEAGGTVSVLDSKFENLHICGSIIKNVAGIRPSTDLSELNSNIVNGDTKSIKLLYDEFQYAMLE